MSALRPIGQLLERRTIFISYRRNDSGGYAGQLFHELHRHYGRHALFLDHQDTEAGVELAPETQHCARRVGCRARHHRPGLGRRV